MPTHPGKADALAALEAFAQPVPAGGVPPTEAVICQVCGSAVDPVTGAPVDAGPPPEAAPPAPPAGPMPMM